MKLTLATLATLIALNLMSSQLPKPELTISARLDDATLYDSPANIIVEARRYLSPTGAPLQILRVDSVTFASVAGGFKGFETRTFKVKDNTSGHIYPAANWSVIACLDLDNNGAYTAGEPYGIASNVDVGWHGGACEIGLTRTSPVAPRFKVAIPTESDRHIAYGRDDGDLWLTNNVGTLSGGVFERVRVIRTFINGQPAYGFDGQVQPRVVLDKMVHVNHDPYITEADFLRDGALDIDWGVGENGAGGLANDLENAGQSNLSISNVSYRIVLGDGDISNLTTNNLLEIVFNRWFDVPDVFNGSGVKDGKPSAVPVAFDLGNVIAVSPTFKWEIPNGFNSYTAFRITVADEKGNEVLDSGFRAMPPRVRDDKADNHSPWHYEWKAPLHAGALTEDGKLFANDMNYMWCVTLANARYRDRTKWSNVATFRMAVPTNTTDVGMINVAVRYFGQVQANATTKPVRVQAFTTPDFSGEPAGEGYVTNVSTIASAETTTENARIIGLAPGTYYLRAYIDTTLDGKLDTGEPRGMRLTRDGSRRPLGTYVRGAAATQVIPIMIED